MMFGRSEMQKPAKRRTKHLKAGRAEREREEEGEKLTLVDCIVLGFVVQKTRRGDYGRCRRLRVRMMCMVSVLVRHGGMSGRCSWLRSSQNDRDGEELGASRFQLSNNGLL